MARGFAPGYSVAKSQGCLIGGCVRNVLALLLLMKSISLSVGVPRTVHIRTDRHMHSWTQSESVVE